MTLKIVADSACDIPAEIATKLAITIVPVYVNVGEKSYLDGVELSRPEFYQNLTDYSPYPTTAAPAAGAFTETYERLAAEGATEILSLHIASSLSATYNAARLGAEAANAVPVTLFDTQQITVGAGLLAIIAAEMANTGDDVAAIVAQLNEYVPHTRVFGTLDTLDSLRRSGRVNWATFGFGTLLQIKPIMMITGGEIEVIAKVRTRKRAVRQMLDTVQTFRPFVRLVVVHVNAAEAAAQLREQALPLFPNDELPIMEIGPAIGTHLGLGAVGFACISVNE